MREQEEKKLKKYDVHLWAMVRVKVAGVEAATPAEAIEAAQDRFYETAHDYFSADSPRGLDAAEVELEQGEPPVYFLVDKQGDREHAHSRYYCSDGVTLLTGDGGRCGLCVRPLAGARRSQKGEAANA